MTGQRFALGACLALAVLSMGSRASAAPFQQAVVLGGGGENDIRIFEKIVELAGRGENARIGVISAAADGGRHQAHFKAYERVFKSLGAHVEWLPVRDDAPELAYDPKVVDRVKNLNVIYFSGGSQNRALNRLIDSSGKD